MTLFSLNDEKIIRLPHKKQYDPWRKNISDSDYSAVVDELNRIFNNLGAGKHVVSSFIPGDDWTGTVWQPLYYACKQDTEASGLFFGQIVWLVAMQRADEWYFYRGDKGDRDYIGMSYFRKA